MDHANLQTELQKALYRLGHAHMEDFGAVTKLEALTMGFLRREQERDPESPGLTVSELVRRCHGSPPAISRTLRQLEGRGLLERSVCRTDRRITYVALTVRGREALDDAWAASQEFVSRVLDRMGEENMLILIGQLNRMADIIEDEQKERTQC